MILKGLLFSVIQFVGLAIISMVVALIIKVIYKAVHRGEARKSEAK